MFVLMLFQTGSTHSAVIPYDQHCSKYFVKSRRRQVL